ncbi:MAG: acyl dehydratase, partial [candidate division Zixibacteria bacterium]|nr:acyl dehydratase [candidate division Zixibacteria bacterium]
MMELAYFEDIEIGEKKILGEHYVDKDEIVEFAKKWDPQPFHIDEQIAKTYPFGGLIASSNYTLCIVTLLAVMQEKPVVAALGLLEYERVKILNPVRPGDRLTVSAERIEKRESNTKPDRGILRTQVEVRNQNNDFNLSYIATVMVAKRKIK